MPIYSDINGFPESGFPVLSNESDYLVLNTLYSVPQKYLGYVMDVSGNNRLLGNLVLGGTLTGVSSLTMAGALSGVTTLAASSTVTLSSATAPLTMTGSDAVLSMTGARASIGTQFQRINKAWFKNLDITDRPTIGEDYVALVGDLRQYAFLPGRLGDILKIDTINEFTNTNGVWIDGLGIKDTGINFEVGATTRIFKDGSNNLSFTDAVTGTKTLAELVGGGGTPGGSDTYIQFNDGGSFAGDSGLVFNKTTNDLTCIGNIKSNNFETNSFSNSVRIGLDAGLSENTTSIRSNVIIGYTSGKNINTGSDNTFVGSESGYYTTTGYSNTFIGAHCGRGNGAGFRNTYVGSYSGNQFNNGGSENVYIGFQIGRSSTSSMNVYIGKECAFSNTTGGSNTFIGYESGYSVTTGSNNTFIGLGSGLYHVSGSYNTFLGRYSGSSNQTGTYNVFLGNYSGYYETGSNKLFIDNQSRTNEATSRTSSLIHGEFNYSTALQWLRINGILQIPDGITAPSTVSGYALIYVDSSDGDLKIKFGDGTVKTIVTDS